MKFYIIRGGSLLNNPRICRSACRGRVQSNYANSNVSFRVVCLHQASHAITLEEQTDG